MFNHESNLRGDSFISKKITKGLAKIKYLGTDPLQIGNFDSCRDWSAAHDLVAAMHLMLNYQLYDDFILASGKIHTIRDILKITSQVLGYDISFEGKGLNEVMVDSKSGQILVQVAQKFQRKFDEYSISGNTSKFSKVSGWSPRITFDELISDMAEFDAGQLSNSNKKLRKYV
jgi:GDPmannose 4,6-dehydratase